ncbi:amidase [Thalassospira lucentensis]|uniref:amidase n=1 Tax=Thalassospira lucentensis TaxID=168935 RepID=UPI00142E869F|nr:amidase family protein [Thalassospira lucentensis]NIZ00044.1 glutamyl-tRNA amidotransferase [Thalassospira lucentensis]
MGGIIDKAKAAIDAVDQLGDLAGKIFTEFDRDRILRDAEQCEEQIAKTPNLPLAGMLVSIKDLYDEAGVATTAASELLKGRSPAAEDCDVVRRVKEAGAVPFGRTTLSEFAYSGVGLNPHYGTPGNVFDPQGIPGGSTSGGGLTVAHGLVDFALGTDTGGSIRIPSAINGLYGFKPSRLSVSGAGIHPLAQSFDTPGPLAPDLETAITVFEVISGQTVPALDASPAPLRIGVPTSGFVDGLDDRVKADFASVCATLRDAGHELVDLDLGFIAENAILNKMLVSAEAYKIYGNDIDKLETCGDPRVLTRIKFAKTLSEDDLIAAYAKRTDVVSMFSTAMAEVDVMIAPTLPMMAPKIAEVEADFDNLNAMMLRNTGYLNLVDACAISMPVPVAGQAAPAALMIGAPHGHDKAVLYAARQLDPLFD